MPLLFLTEFILLSGVRGNTFMPVLFIQVILSRLLGTITYMPILVFNPTEKYKLISITIQKKTSEIMEHDYSSLPTKIQRNHRILSL